uniref:Uncharacterized protein n=1 Tax=Noctiluca scintillans TaxID=2966 RepID=A0A7S1AFC6_NOCSC
MAVVDIVADGTGGSPFASLCHPRMKAKTHGLSALIRPFQFCTRSRRVRENLETPFRTQPWKPWPEVSSHHLAELARTRTPSPLSRVSSSSSLFGEEMTGNMSHDSFDVDTDSPGMSRPHVVPRLKTKFPQNEFRPLESERQRWNEYLTMEIFAPDRVDCDAEAELVEVIEFVVALPPEALDHMPCLGYPFRNVLNF